jgi:hypothetical protein
MNQRPSIDQAAFGTLPELYVLDGRECGNASSQFTFDLAILVLLIAVSIRG